MILSQNYKSYLKIQKVIDKKSVTSPKRQLVPNTLGCILYSTKFHLHPMKKTASLIWAADYLTGQKVLTNFRRLINLIFPTPRGLTTYLLPMIHKFNNHSRTIASARNYLQVPQPYPRCLAASLLSHIHHTNHVFVYLILFPSFLATWTPITLDIHFLYTMISHNESFLALKHFQEFHPEPHSGTSTLSLWLNSSFNPTAFRSRETFNIRPTE